MFTYKNVLITGASSGIGQALAEYYAQNGARLWRSIMRKMVLMCFLFAGEMKNA